MTKQTPLKDPHVAHSSLTTATATAAGCIAGNNGGIGGAWPEGNWVGLSEESGQGSSTSCSSSNSNGQVQYFKPLEDDHIEQMIEELLDYGYMELCPGVP